MDWKELRISYMSQSNKRIWREKEKELSGRFWANQYAAKDINRKVLGMKSQNAG